MSISYDKYTRGIFVNTHLTRDYLDHISSKSSRIIFPLKSLSSCIQSNILSQRCIFLVNPWLKNMVIYRFLLFYQMQYFHTENKNNQPKSVIKQPKQKWRRSHKKRLKITKNGVSSEKCQDIKFSKLGKKLFFLFSTGYVFTHFFNKPCFFVILALFSISTVFVIPYQIKFLFRLWNFLLGFCEMNTQKYVYDNFIIWVIQLKIGF